MSISFPGGAIFAQSANLLEIYGSGFNSILSPGENSGTDIKAQINWGQLFWDFDSNGADLLPFALSDIAHAYVDNDDQLNIILTPAFTTTLTSTPGFGGNVPNSLDLFSGFLVDQSGNPSPTTLEDPIGYNTTINPNQFFYAGNGPNILDATGGDVVVIPAATVNASDVSGSGGHNDLFISGSGSFNLSNPYAYGYDSIYLTGGGPNVLVLYDLNFSNTTSDAITVYGGDNGNTVVDTGTSTAESFVFYDGGGTETVFGGPGNDVFVFNAANMTNAQTIDGGLGNDQLVLIGGGTLGLQNVSGIETIRLGTGGLNILSLSNYNVTTATGDALFVYGGNSGNSVDASAVNQGQVVYIAGSENDAFLGGQDGNTIVVGSGAAQTLIGGSGNDTFQATAANLTNTDVLMGGAGTNLLVMQSAGVINDDGVSGIEGIVLASGTANSLILTDVNFAGVTDDQIVVIGGNSGNAVNGAGLSPFHSLAVTAGTGTDELVGGAGNDQFTLLGGDTTVQGNGGINGYFFDGIDHIATILDYKHDSDFLEFKNTAFNLGADNGLPTGQLAASVFSSNTNGTFATSGNRFAYDTANGALNYNPTGSVTPGDTVQIASLDMSNNTSLHPTITLADLYFQP